MRLRSAAAMHDERHDGSGYQRGATTAETPAGARVLTVDDAYQAMTQRPHNRPALSDEEASSVV